MISAIVAPWPATCYQAIATSIPITWVGNIREPQKKFGFAKRESPRNGK
jgi:hypothetical protein